ncbi:MAG TPA: hypothetical protein VNA25_23230, partial [Phycisphaerae bacterium]|nr:hypothetical protein [Phycisphaerae bacterium]
MAENKFQLGGVDSLASTPGNWSLGYVPITTETLLFDATSPDCTWDIALPTYCPVTGALAAWNMTGYTGTLTPTVGTHLVFVSGDVTPDGVWADSETDVMVFTDVGGSLIEGAAFSSVYGPVVILRGTGTITWGV